MSESVEVRVARIEENMRFMIDETKEARSARKSQYEAIEAVRQMMSSMDVTLNAVQNKLDGQAPTIEEFITIKHKVVGAGKLGAWLWAAGAFIIGAVFSSRETIISLFTR